MNLKTDKLNILILVNTLQNVNQFIYSNHIEFFTWTAKNYPNIDFKFFSPVRMSIDNARNTAATLAMRYECDYLMFIDDDVLIPKDTLVHLLEANKDVCAGLVIIRGMPFHVMAFKFSKDNPMQLTNYDELPLHVTCKQDHEFFKLDCKDCEIAYLEPLVRCDAVGFSCCLIKTDILKPLEPPYFLTGPNHTEDVYFCLKLRELEPIPSIYMNTSVRCGHLLNPEPIEFGTIKKFKSFYEEEYELLNMKFQRDEAHIQRCLVSLEGFRE